MTKRYVIRMNLACTYLYLHGIEGQESDKVGGTVKGGPGVKGL